MVVADAGLRYVISVFAAKLVSGEATAGPEASEVKWLDPAAIAALDATDGLQDFAYEGQRLFLAAKA